MQPNEWIIEGEVGTSSKTIWVVMMGVVKTPRICDWTYDTPNDPDDFLRCWKLFRLFPYWESRIKEVGELFPKWKPFCREWDKLTDMFSQYQSDYEKYQNSLYEHRTKKSHSKKPRWEDFDTTEMYDFMQTLDAEGMILDGWKQDGPGCWSRSDK